MIIFIIDVAATRITEIGDEAYYYLVICSFIVFILLAFSWDSPPPPTPSSASTVNSRGGWAAGGTVMSLASPASFPMRFVLMFFLSLQCSKGGGSVPVHPMLDTPLVHWLY